MVGEGLGGVEMFLEGSLSKERNSLSLCSRWTKRGRDQDPLKMEDPPLDSTIELFGMISWLIVVVGVSVSVTITVPANPAVLSTL